MLKKESARVARHKGIRKKIVGTLERPRLSVHRSSKHLYVQLIDDIAAQTLCAFSTVEKAFLSKNSKKNKTEQADHLASHFAERLKEKGIQKVAFDRGGYQYHGRIKALADSLRKAGIQF